MGVPTFRLLRLGTGASRRPRSRRYSRYRPSLRPCAAWFPAARDITERGINHLAVARILALVDGEHYPPVVRDAIAVAAARGEVVAALLLGGREKLDGTPDYGVPLERGAADPATAMVDAARRL